MWQTEKEFGKYLMGKLKKEGCDCMRVETASTIVGCPDLWVQFYGDDCFIELKNIHHDLPANSDLHIATENIPWRPGQQAWAARYKMYHLNKYSWTFVGMNDGMLAIKMEHIFSYNTIEYADPCIHIFNKRDLRDLVISRLLRNNTYIGGKYAVRGVDLSAAGNAEAMD